MDAAIDVREDSVKHNALTDWLTARTSRARQWLHYRLPNLAMLQDAATRAYVKERDQRANTETRVPVEESLRLNTLWGVEIYGPAEIDGLYASLKRLDWDHDRFSGAGRGVLKWISEQRTYGSEGNLNLGTIHRKGQRGFLPNGRHANVPEAVDYMHGYVYQISPSTTAIILCFVLRDEASLSYEVSLNTDRQTTNERNRKSGGYRIFDVEHGKRRDIDERRLQARGIVTEWFEDNLPGFFSLAEDGNRLPTAELITTQNEPLLSEAASVRRLEPTWARILTNYGFRDVWTLKDFSGLSLAWDVSEEVGRFHAIVNLRTGLLQEEHLKHLGDRSRHSYSAYASQRIEGILVHFAAIVFLRDALRSLRLTRDTITKNPKTHRQVLTAIAQIKSFFDRSIGLPTMTAELVAKSETNLSYRWDCEAFESEPWRPGEQSSKIVEVLRDRTHHLATRVVAQERETRDHLQQVSTILSVQESVKAQRRMELLTVAATVVAAVSLLVALLSLEQFVEAVGREIGRVWKAN